METRRGEARAWLVRATSAATRLANVVCRPRLVSAESMVCADRDRLVARQTASRRAVRGKPVSRKSTALYSRDVVSISIHERGGTPQTGAWWKRQALGEYLPSVSLED